MMMKIKLIGGFLLFSLRLVAQAQLGFDFEHPTATIQLDSTLREISGLSVVPGDTALLACVQDETGVLYFISKDDGTTKCKYAFKAKGDFEGVEILDKTAYAMKSDGDLYIIHLENCNRPKTTVLTTNLGKERDIESLAFDPDSNQLIFITKEDPKQNITRTVYSLSLPIQPDTKPQVKFEIDPAILRTKAVEEAKNWFSPSGLVIDPETKLWWVLSSASKEIAAFDQNGKLVQIISLAKEIYAQPEGICLDAQGNLYISNEAKNGKSATLLKLENKHKTNFKND
jgi:uncharacterized protein YjiK